MSINFATATAEEIEAAFNKLQQEKQELEQQVKAKKTNKTDKLLTDLKQLFNDYSDNSTDTLFWLYYCLSALFSNIQIPIIEELDKLDYVPEEEDLRKLNNIQVKVASKNEDLKLRKTKKTSVVPVETIEPKEINTPL